MSERFVSLSLRTAPAKVVKGSSRVHVVRKQVIKKGDYVKDDFRFSVDDKVLDHWVNTFKRYRAAGNRVSVPLGHKHAADPAKNKGWVTNLERDDDDGLTATMELYGNDVPDLIAANDVSIHAPAVFRDGKGNEYELPIQHVALCPDPVIPGLKSFERLSLSFKTETNVSFMAKLAELLELDGEKDGPDGEEQILAAIKALMMKKNKKDEDPAPAPEQEPPPPPSPNITASMGRVIAENRAHRINDLVRKGCVTPAAAKDLMAQYADSKRTTISLSQGNGETDDVAFDALISALQKNKALSYGERSGPQVVELSRGDNEDVNVLGRAVDKRREALGVKK